MAVKREKMLMEKHFPKRSSTYPVHFQVFIAAVAVIDEVVVVIITFCIHSEHIRAKIMQYDFVN
jgi:Na+/H+ antiporter NhaA